VEEIRKLAITLGKSSWIKAHVGIYGNVLTDKLTKEASRKYISFKRKPEIEIIHQLREQSIAKWRNQWDRTAKGQATKNFFQSSRIDGQKIKINTKVCSNSHSPRQNQDLHTPL